MQFRVLGILVFILGFDHIYAAVLSQIEQATFENRVKHADTILFGRFNWDISLNQNDDMDQIYSLKQDTFEFIVYCTIKKTGGTTNVPHLIQIIIEDAETEIDMRKNRWFVVFPTKTDQNDIWLIANRSMAFDLEDDIQLHIFEQFCFLNPKLPIGFPNNGFLNRCPKPSREYCTTNGTKILHDELLELKTFLTSTTTPKKRTTVAQRTSTRKTTQRQRKRFIEPIW